MLDLSQTSVSNEKRAVYDKGFHFYSMLVSNWPLYRPLSFLVSFSLLPKCLINEDIPLCLMEA
jgi:hypothetical protein